MKLTIKPKKRPYVVFSLLLSPIYIIFILGTIKQGLDENSIKAVSLVTALFGVFLYFFYSWSVTVDGEKVYWRLFLSRTKIMPVADIKKVAVEGGYSKRFAVGRPFRRVSLYDTKNRFIDISLTAFDRNKVDEILKAIHEQRPDLNMPKLV